MGDSDRKRAIREGIKEAGDSRTQNLVKDVTDLLVRGTEYQEEKQAVREAYKEAPRKPGTLR